MTGNAPDTDRLNEFLGRFVGDLAATAAAGNVVVGHRLGLYAALARGAATASDLAERINCAVRPLTEWLRAQVGEARIRRVTTDAGFTRFRRAAETPFNLVFEVRP